MKGDTLFRNYVIALLVLIVAAYSNHFGNSFHFDDSHCINNNAYIRSLKNIPEFFKSAKTFSSLPYNQTYRPMLTTLYALDYAVGGFYTFFYHLPIFLFFLAQGFLMYLLIIKLFDASFKSNLNKYFALFTTGWYMLATANADTINYISSSSDSISTFWVIAALVLYIYKPSLRKYFLYFIPVIIGALFKQSAIVFPALLGVYAFLFEKKTATDTILQRLLHAIVVVIPSLVICAALYVLQSKLTSATYLSGGNMYTYLITQPFVILHYFITFFFPFGLSADSDWVPLTSMANGHFMIGMVFILLLVVSALVMLRAPKYAPVVFGIAWFLIALIPSSVVPLAEVMNDHRAFFPYVGLVIAAGWLLFLLWEKLDVKYFKAFRAGLICILIFNAVGTFARNFVWWNEETLWHDVTIKSPGNGRGQMNYGLSLMSKGDLAGAEKQYKKALELMPYYAYAYENMAILKAVQKQNDTAEVYYKKALEFGNEIPVLYYYYAKYLHEQNRNTEAEPLLKEAIMFSPADADSRYLLMEIYQDEEKWPDLIALANQTLTLLPNDPVTKNYLANSIGKKSKLEQAIDLAKTKPTPDNYLSLSLLYYNQKQYDKCIEACEEALKLDPTYYLAYNNIGSAYNATGEWKKAIDVFSKALSIKPDFALARNNCALALRQMSVTDSMKNVVQQAPTPDNYLNLSLMYYRQSLFMKSIDACKAAIKLNPRFALAYNNMCAAYNMLGMWNEAISAGELAMRLDPNNQLIKNNLAEARKGKANSVLN